MATRRSGEGLGSERGTGAAPSGSRRPELDDWLNARLFHPAARRLAAGLAGTPVTPNMVSVGGGLLIVAAGIFYTRLAWPASVLLGFAAHALWHVLDGADGDLARLTGKASPVGEIVDGVCDYFGHIVVYVLLAAFLAGRIGGGAWAIAAVAGASRILQSNHAESNRRTYLWRVYNIPWLKQVYEAGEPALRRGVAARLLEPLARLYVGLAAAGEPLSGRLDLMIERSAAAGPAAREQAARLCREESRLPLRLQTLLGANGRTVALGLSMAAGSPLWFFLLEATLLNLLLAFSASLQRAADRRILAKWGRQMGTVTVCPGTRTNGDGNYLSGYADK
ncbi:MAG: CDP-alcohol phosphatidyltransferase family protein [Alphaproteobacteria bacterium]|nr:CDP-alcohol phosphatidyltransferase family protein [Alphaproteobacteria bacterium]MBV9370140.1 CDP-alcohol phosphatidyltransferase family protein [Alphaproteobacteria bacterium]MBV9901480.1 CDP-alcohol phosphatidyltransferase family protein [Alphaproteobacteria bacterium]